ncbi:MAG: hypothetical protein HPY59_17065 [Anaerolineae bacterium]|nr:hypothetical protein [Anaerolineae bacterium]
MEGNTQEIAKAPSPTPSPTEKGMSPEDRRRLAFLIAGVVLFLGLIIIAVYFLMQPATPTDKIRDVFIIFMALESLVIGIALVILMVQLATLINLLQNEIKPILDSTNETVNTIRGTATFLSDNLAEPVIKLNEYLAGIKRLLELFRLIKK